MTRAATTDSAIPSTGRDRRCLLPFLAPVILLFGCSTSAVAEVTAVAEVPRDLFEQYDVVLGMANRPSVLTGFLRDGDVAELAVVRVNDAQERLLRVYEFEGHNWAPKLDAKLGPDVLFVDVANIGGRERLIAYQPGRLNWFDPDSGSEKPLVAVTSCFTPPRRNEVPHVDVTRDVNADGRDDLVVPDTDGFWVFVQRPGGTWADPVRIGTATDLSRIYWPDGYRYDPWSQARVHAMDYDLDGRNDLVFWKDDHFEVHVQDERGLFAPATETFTSAVALDSDNPSYLSTGGMTGRALHSIADLNGDGMGDLVVQTLTGRRSSKKRSTYELHFGVRAPGGGTTFTAEPGATFRAHRRVHVGMDRYDFDRDGQIDLMLTTVHCKFLEGSLWKRIKGAMGDDVWLDLEFYRNEGGRFADEPDSVRTIALDGAPSHREPGWVPLDIVLRGATHEARRTQWRWPRAFNPNLLIGDVTGDGRADVLAEDSFRGLNVHVGVPRGLFAERPEIVRVIVPHDNEYTWLMDVNKDGKQDIVMHHPFTERDIHGGRRRPPGTEAHRVTMMIAQ